ncbi:MAG: zf-HC2 domain-containing protein [Blastocatellia bacterium]|nr:zf-HC2 domain-containing protein [Blastocatellia bacterium]
MTQFRDRTLGGGALCEIARHVEACASCHREYREVFREKRGPEPAWFEFTSESWLKEEHLERAELLAYVEGAVEAEDGEIFEAHLRQCDACRAEAARLRDARREAPARDSKWREAVARLRAWVRAAGPAPVWALPALALLLFLLLLGAIRWGRWGQSGEPRPKEMAGEPPKATSREAADRAAAPAPTASPEERKRPAPVDLSGARARGRMAPPTILPSILPPILEDLMIEPGMTRSDPRGETDFRLVSPPQEVVAEDLPAFRWEGLQGATGYKLFVASPSDWKAIESPTLPPTARSWTPPAPLRRGETYTWVVHAFTAEGDVRLPSPNEPERRFKVLNARDFRRLSPHRRAEAPRLARALQYVQMGMLREAETELLRFPEQGPDAAFVARLLAQIRAWQQMQP